MHQFCSAPDLTSCCTECIFSSLAEDIRVMYYGTLSADAVNSVTCVWCEIQIIMELGMNAVKDPMGEA